METHRNCVPIYVFAVLVLLPSIPYQLSHLALHSFLPILRFCLLLPLALFYSFLSPLYDLTYTPSKSCLNLLIFSYCHTPPLTPSTQK